MRCRDAQLRSAIVGCSRAIAAAMAISLCIASVFADAIDTYRVAAINYTQQNSRVLIEDARGEQSWYRVGDSIGPADIVRIAKHSITLNEAGTTSLMYLRRSGGLPEPSLPEPIAPPSERSETFQFVGLMSEIGANDRQPGESQAASDTRVMNRVLGLADKARITAIDRVDVSTAAEARTELQQRLVSNEPIRITIEGDELEVLYVVPDY